MKIHRPALFFLAIVFLLIGGFMTYYGFTIESKQTHSEDNIVEAVFNIFDAIFNAIVAFIKAAILIIVGGMTLIASMLCFLFSFTSPKKSIQSNSIQK